MIGTELGVLGPLVASVDGMPLRVGRGAHRLVLNVLAVSPRGAHVDELVDVLADLAGGAARTAHNVHTAVTRLRSMMPGCIESHAGQYRLVDVTVDADVFRDKAQAAMSLRQGDGGTAVAELRDALAIWRGPALDDWRTHPRARAHAEQLEELRLGSMHELAAALVDVGADTEALAVLSDVTAQDPLRERSWVLLMDVQARLGRADDVARSVTRSLNALAEVGLDPGPDLRASVGRFRPASIVAAALDAPGDGRIVGRAPELRLLDERMAHALEGGPAEVVAITGEAGVGKSRFALELVRAWAARGVAATLLRGRAGLQRATDSARAGTTGLFVIDEVDDDALLAWSHQGALADLADLHGIAVAVVGGGYAQLPGLRSRLTLRQLDHESAAALLRRSWRGPIDDAALARAWRLCAGNPGLSRALAAQPELVRSADWGEFTLAAGPFADEAASHLARLPDSIRGVLEWAAVAAHPSGAFDASVLRAVVAANDDSPFDALDAITGAYRMGILALDQADASRGRFVHDGLRLAGYAAIASARRAGAHLAVARTLERAGSDSSQLELAAHLSRSWPAIGAAEAAEACRKAGEWAATSGAPELAIAQFAAAIDVLLAGEEPGVIVAALRARIADCRLALTGSAD